MPDFLLLVETSRLESRPLLVEVKRVPRRKAKLELRGNQMRLCESYAAALQIPLVYAIYWERFSAWTLNTPDVFGGRSATRRLPAESAFETDCGLILGDISYLVPPALARVSRYSAQGTADDVSEHAEFGQRVSDVVSLGEKTVEMDELESAAVDSILTMTRVHRASPGDGQTELVERPDGPYLLKLSSWINRHLAIFDVEPSEQHANLSAHVIARLMEKLACPPLHSFPMERSVQMRELADVFLSAGGTPSPDRAVEDHRTDH